MTADYTQSCRPTPLEDDLVDKAVGSYGQPRSIARRVEVADCRAHPHAAVDIKGQGPDTRGAGAIVVRAVGNLRLYMPGKRRAVEAPIRRAGICGR